MGLRDTQYKHMTQTDDQLYICGVETSGSTTVAFVNVGDECCDRGKR
jgi:hypothetical protein